MRRFALFAPVAVALVTVTAGLRYAEGPNHEATYQAPSFLKEQASYLIVQPALYDGTFKILVLELGTYPWVKVEVQAEQRMDPGDVVWLNLARADLIYEEADISSF